MLCYDLGSSDHKDWQTVQHLFGSIPYGMTRLADSHSKYAPDLTDIRDTRMGEMIMIRNRSSSLSPLNHIPMYCYFCIKRSVLERFLHHLSFFSPSFLRITLSVPNMFTSALGLAVTALPFAFAATYDVSVGAGGQLAFDPQFVTAVAGDVINFVL